MKNTKILGFWMNHSILKIIRLSKIWVTLLLIIACSTVRAQSEKMSSETAIGFEVDALPYITGGYYGSVWVGKNHMRYRAILTKIKVPEFVLKDDFTNNEIQAYTLIADYFFKPNFEKWWVGAGLEYWQGKIQSEAKIETAKYNNTIFTVGGGYVWKFYRNFYLNPWVALHVKISGDSKVLVDNKIFEPSFITSEASLKIGWYFN